MGSIIGRLDRFWFAEAPAARLAALRILVGSYAVWLLHWRSDEILELARLPASQFQPVGVTSFLTAPLPSQAISGLLTLAMIVSVLFVLGFAYRVTGPLFAVLLLAVLTYFASWGSVNHPDALVTAHVLVLGLTRAADAVSLDALIRAWCRRGGRPTSATLPDPAGAWQYGFAIKLICAVTATSYLLAGIAKVSSSHGWGWATGEALLLQVAWDGLRKELLAQPPPAQAAVLYQHVWLFTVLAVGSLIVELGAPLALLNRRLGYLWVLAAFPMHWGIYFIMGISFKYYLWGIAYASFFSLEGVGALMRPASVREWLGRIRPPRLSPAWTSAMGRRAALLGLVTLLCAGSFAAGSHYGATRGAGVPVQPAPRVANAESRSSSAAANVQNGSASGVPKPQSRSASRSATAQSQPAAVTAGSAQPAAEPFRVVWVGDILLGDDAQRSLDEHGYTWPFERVRGLLAGDFAIGNAEGPITTLQTPRVPEARYSYNIDPRAAVALREVGFRAVTLANNHALDRGSEGLSDTTRYLREVGIQAVGAGLDDDEAARPLLIDTPHGWIAVVALGPTGPNSPTAGPGKPGVRSADSESVVRGRELAKAAGARWVVGYLHWGDNYEPVTAKQRRLAEEMAQAGYDLVIGHGSHSLQPVEVVNGMPVVYSLGNFTFGSRGRFTEEFPGYGVVARTAFGPNGLEPIELACIVTAPGVVGFQPRPCKDAEAQRVSTILGPRLTWEAGRGLVPSS